MGIFVKRSAAGWDQLILNMSTHVYERFVYPSTTPKGFIFFFNSNSLILILIQDFSEFLKIIIFFKSLIKLILNIITIFKYITKISKSIINLIFLFYTIIIFSLNSIFLINIIIFLNFKIFSILFNINFNFKSIFSFSTKTSNYNILFLKFISISLIQDLFDSTAIGKTCQ